MMEQNLSSDIQKKRQINAQDVNTFFSYHLRTHSRFVDHTAVIVKFSWLQIDQVMSITR